MTIRTLLMVALACAPAIATAQTAGGSDPTTSTETHTVDVERRLDTLIPRGLCVAEAEALRMGYDIGGSATAEAVGLPSPERAIELANELTLNVGQIEEINALWNVELVNSRRLGRSIIEQEAKLDSVFATQPRDWMVRPIVLEIGRLQTELRYVHLRARMRMKDVLSPTQQRRYASMATKRVTEHADTVGE
jgi:hypothetical protein